MWCDVDGQRLSLHLKESVLDRGVSLNMFAGMLDTPLHKFKPSYTTLVNFSKTYLVNINSLLINCTYLKLIRYMKLHLWNKISWDSEFIHKEKNKSKIHEINIRNQIQSA